MSLESQGKPMAGGIGMVDFDSDYESDGDKGASGAPAPVAKPTGSSGGSQNHRPMVGGFAAAAYEAARAHHLAQQKKKQQQEAAAAAAARK